MHKSIKLKQSYNSGSEAYLDLVLKTLTQMSLDTVNEENSWIINYTNKHNRKDSLLRRLKKRTGFIFSKHGNTSSAGYMSVHRQEIRYKYKAYRFNGAKLKPKHFRWGISFKTDLDNWNDKEWFNKETGVMDWKMKHKCFNTEYGSIIRYKDIGCFKSDDQRYHILCTVAHEFAHIVCGWIKWVGYINRHPRLQNLDETKIKHIYQGHQIGWQEVYRKFRQKYVNPYVCELGVINESHMTKREKANNIMKEAAESV